MPVLIILFVIRIYVWYYYIRLILLYGKEINMIELKNVSKTYKSKKGKSTKALDDVSITFAKKRNDFYFR